MNKTLCRNWRARAVGVILLAAFSAGAWAQAKPFDIDGFEWEQPISVVQENGFVTVPLGREVLDGAQPSLDDLRVLDADNNLVPHVIQRERLQLEPSEMQRPVQILNRTYEIRQHARAVLDFGAMVEKNRVEVEVSGTNFRRKAQLEGSSDSQAWEMVAENLWLFDVRLSGKDFHTRVLEFPANNFRYLRLTVSHMPDDPERIEIERVTSAMEVAPFPEDTTEFELTPGNRQWSEVRKTSTWDIDLGSRHLPVVMLDFDITDEYFYRGYELHGRNTTAETVENRTETGVKSTERETPWRLLNSGMLYRTVEATTTTQDLKLENLGAIPRYLQLRIYDADNPPLNLRKATASGVFPKLVFEGKQKGQYRLVYGNEQIGAPSYDLERAVRDLDPQKLPTVKLSTANRLSQSTKTPPWTERNATWLLLLLAAAAIGMGTMLVSSLKRMPPGGGDTPN